MTYMHASMHERNKQMNIPVIIDPYLSGSGILKNFLNFRSPNLAKFIRKPQTQIQMD